MGLGVRAPISKASGAWVELVPEGVFTRQTSFQKISTPSRTGQHSPGGGKEHEEACGPGISLKGVTACSRTVVERTVVIWREEAEMKPLLFR